MNPKQIVRKLLPLTLQTRLDDFRYRPRNLKMGEGSVLVKPRNLVARDCITIGSRCLVQPDARFFPIKSYGNQKFTPRITIRDDVYIGNAFHIVSAYGITIGSGCVISDFVYMNDHGHGLDPSEGLIMNQPLSSKGEVHIGDHCFIGYRSIILSGVTLGHHCVVGAGSVVTKSYPDYSVIAGNPARLIKTQINSAKPSRRDTCVLSPVLYR